MNRNFDEIIFNCITSVNALMTSNEVAKDDKAVIKLNRFKKWLNEFASANGNTEVGSYTGDDDREQ
jgi:hypothetical protein